MARVQGGCGGSSRPPWTSGRSGERRIRREREVLWELLVGDGELDPAREQERCCLGGSCGWCELGCRVGGLFEGQRKGAGRCTGATIMLGNRPVGVEGEVMGLGRRLQSTEGCSRRVERGLWGLYWEH
jgi:hypothetical protein